jgi:hypothetical protein
LRDLSVFFQEYMPLREDYMDEFDLIESIREEEKDEH